MENLNEWQDKFEQCLLEHPSDDGSHDITHFRRVWALAQDLSRGEGDQLVILAASYFHDIVNYPKDDPRRSESSRDAAEKASEILAEMDFPEDKILAVKHCIQAHSFSANIPCKTMEAKVVQDADRMESLGAIGVARTFYVAGRMGSKLFDGEDPFAENRKLDDKAYALDHFKTKLLKLPQTMQTPAGREEAEYRAEVLLSFMGDLRGELRIDED